MKRIPDFFLALTMSNEISPPAAERPMTIRGKTEVTMTARRLWTR